MKKRRNRSIACPLGSSALLGGEEGVAVIDRNACRLVFLALLSHVEDRGAPPPTSLEPSPKKTSSPPPRPPPCSSSRQECHAPSFSLEAGLVSPLLTKHIREFAANSRETLGRRLVLRFPSKNPAVENIRSAGVEVACIERNSRATNLMCSEALRADTNEEKKKGNPESVQGGVGGGSASMGLFVSLP